MKIAFYSDHTFEGYNPFEKLFASELGNLCSKATLYTNPNRPDPNSYDVLILGNLWNKHGNSQWASVCRSFSHQQKKILLLWQSTCFDSVPFGDHVDASTHSLMTIGLPPGAIRECKAHGKAYEENQLPSLCKYFEFPSIALSCSLYSNTLSRKEFFLKYNLNPERKLICIFATRSDRYSYWPLSVAQKHLYFYEHLNEIVRFLNDQGYEVIFKFHRAEFTPKIARLSKSFFSETSLPQLVTESKIPTAAEIDTQALLHHSDLSIVLGESDVSNWLYVFNLPTLVFHFSSTRKAACPWLYGKDYLSDYFWGLDCSLDDFNENPPKKISELINYSQKPKDLTQPHPIWGNAYEKDMGSLASMALNALTHDSQ